jgi:hypothetical protein
VARAELLSRLAEVGGLPDGEVVTSGARLPRAVAVEVTGPFRLRARYDDGRVAEADLEGLAHRSEHFARLRDPAVTARVEIVHEGAALRFAGDEALEIGAELLLALQERQQAMSGAAFAAWLRRHRLSENAAAEVLGLARRTVQGYKAAATVPRWWWWHAGRSTPTRPSCRRCTVRAGPDGRARPPSRPLPDNETSQATASPPRPSPGSRPRSCSSRRPTPAARRPAPALSAGPRA